MKTSGLMFKYFGSKFSRAKVYPTPTHSTIIEPYAGGAGFSLNYSDRNVIISENNEEVFSLWKYLIEECSSSEILEIPLDLPIGTEINSLALNPGQKLLLKYWQRTNNLSKCSTISVWGNKNGQWTKGTRSRLAIEISYIKHWILHPSAEIVFDLYSNRSDVSWFVDPPYEFNYRYASKTFDYNQLATNVKRCNGEVIVCEGEGKEGEVPTYLPFVPLYTNKIRYTKRQSTELWYNRNMKIKTLLR